MAITLGAPPVEDVVLVDVIQSVVDSMEVQIPEESANFVVHYEPGRSYDIIKSISGLDNSITYKDVKYPLFAMLMPIPEKRGETGYYAEVTIPRIIIAYLTKTGGGEEGILEKYNSAGVFKTILYPLYKEFFKRLGLCTSINTSDPDDFEHTKMDNPGQQVEASTNDFIDSIEILNLKFILLNKKTCKT